MLNDEWLSESTVQDPTPLPKIPGYRLLIRPVPIRTKTKGGIILPDSAQKRPQGGKIIAVGDGKLLDNGEILAVPVAVGW